MGTGLAVRANPTMQRTLVTPPALEPITFVEAKLHLRVEDDVQDDHIIRLVTAARRYVEQYCRIALITQTWRVTMDEFPDDDVASGWPGLIRLPYPPLQSVTSVGYADSAGVSQTLSSTLYGVETAAFLGQIRTAYNEVWPATLAHPNAVTIEYVAGYGDAEADVPADIRHAMLLLVGHWYENREPVITGTIATPLPFTVESLLSSYRVVEFA